MLRMNFGGTKQFSARFVRKKQFCLCLVFSNFLINESKKKQKQKINKSYERGHRQFHRRRLSGFSLAYLHKLRHCHQQARTPSSVRFKKSIVTSPNASRFHALRQCRLKS